MSDKSFMRDNAVLLLGILLPVLLIAFIGISNEMAQKSVADPEYAVLYSRTTGYHTQFDTTIVNNKLTLSYNKKNNHAHRPTITFYLYDFSSEELKTYEYKAPDIAQGESKDIELDRALSSLSIHKGSISPDNYNFETEYRSSSPFNFFGSSRGRAIITKDTRRIKLPQSGRYAYNLEAVGWVKPSEIGDGR